MPPSRYCFCFTLLALSSGLAFTGTPVTAAQTAAALSPAQSAMAPAQMGINDALSAIQPLLAQVNQGVSSVDVHRWKVPNDVRETTSSDVQSIQRDLTTTLPGLLSQAQGSPAAIAPAFAVFRNIDALYDVLLRVTETATLAGTQAEAGRLESTRAELQSRRAQLGNAILASATAQDSTLVQLRSSLSAASKAAVSAAAPPKKVVVDDGPATPAARTTRKKKTATSPTAPPAAPAQ